MSDWRVIFDIGGVLVPWNPAAVLRDFYPDARLHAPILEAVYRHPDWQALDEGTLDETLAIQRMAQRSGRAPAEMRRLMQATRDSLQPIEASWQLVRTLHRQGVPLYCLSNMPQRTFDQLRERIADWSLFSGLVISGCEKLIKPDPAIFELIVSRHRLEPSRTVFIDDLAANAAAARACGLHAIVFEDASQCARALSEITGMSIDMRQGPG